MDNSNKGLVTFADIMGWKGIWLREDKNPIQEIIRVKSDIVSYASKQSIDNLYRELRKHYPELRELEFSMTGLGHDPIGSAIEILQPMYGEDINLLRTKLMNLLAQIDVTYSIDLVSDTFIICTASQDKQSELDMHGRICKKLIDSCLQNSLLIRGATSYGEYSTEQSVFVGPAIDDAASWHEMGQEVAIFLSPSAFLNFEKELFGCGEYVRRDAILKSGKLDTYCVKWEDPDELFHQIAMGESPMHPEVADKYLNTLEYLNSQRGTEEGNAESNGADV